MKAAILLCAAGESRGPAPHERNFEISVQPLTLSSEAVS